MPSPARSIQVRPRFSGTSSRAGWDSRDHKATNYGTTALSRFFTCVNTSPLREYVLGKPRFYFRGINPMWAKIIALLFLASGTLVLTQAAADEERDRKDSRNDSSTASSGTSTRRDGSRDSSSSSGTSSRSSSRSSSSSRTS